LWAHAAGAHKNIKALVHDFCARRASANAKALLDKWQGSLVNYDFSGYKPLMGDSAGQITEVSCWAHARRKFHNLLQASQSQMTDQANRAHSRGGAAGQCGSWSWASNQAIASVK